MKVLHVFKTYMPETIGGVERVIGSIAAGTAGFGFESTVLSLGDRTDLSGVVDGHRAVTAKRDFELASTGFSRDFLRLLKREAENHDIINYHFPWPFMDLAHFLARPDRKYVVIYHSDIVRQRYLEVPYQPLMNWFLSRADRIVATSQNYVSTSPALPRHAHKIEVIPAGIEDVAATAFDAALAADWRRRFPRPFFLFTGMLRYYKGLEFLISAARNVPADIVIAGAGGEENRLRESVQEHNVENVHFLGSVTDSDKFALLSICDGFVFPSHLRSEAFGISLVEAAMMGRPMISCEIGTGTSFVNRHGETGLVVPPANPDALARAMNRFLKEPQLSSSFGNAARRRFEQLFTAQAMGAKYARMYFETLGGEA